MAKLTLSDFVTIANQQSFITTLNANFGLIEAALELTLSRDGTSPNEMEADFDMNSNRILNLVAAVDDTEPIRKAEFDDLEAEFDTLETNINNAIAAVQALQTELEEDIASIGDVSADAAAAAASAAAAAASAAAALASETAAETAETNAETAETNAETAETNAEAAQAAAEAAQAAAEAAQTAAETAETNAETAEANAELAEANAELAETNAETAEANAETAQAAAEDAQAYAEEWAINPEDDPVSVAAGGDDLTTFSALHWAAKAADSAATLTDEYIQDLVGAMTTGNTETLITVTYQDSDGTIDFVVNNDLSAYDNSTSAFLTSTTADALFLTPAEGNAAYQPLDSDLTSWAGVTRASGFDTFVATPSQANFMSLITDETFVVDADIGVTVQAYDADLTTWAGLTPSANAQSLVTAANYAAMRTLLDLEAGTDFYSIAAADAAFQPLDADLTAIAALTTTAAGRSTLTVADNNLDQVLAWDDTAGTVKTMPLADITAEAAPASGDYFLLYGAEGDLRKVDVDDMPSGDAFPADPGADRILFWDDSDGTVEWAALADITAEASPAGGDYILIYGAEGDLRKVDWDDLPGVGGGISNVVEDTTPQLGGPLDLLGQTLFDSTATAEATFFATENGFMIDGVAGSLAHLEIRGNNDGVSGSILYLTHESASPALNDYPAEIIINAGADSENIASISWRLIDGATTTEDVSTEFWNYVAGTGHLGMSVGDGVIIGSDTTFPGEGNLAVPSGFIQLTEIAAPGAGAANTVRLYAKDDGGGNTQLCAIGSGGTEVVICTLS